MRGINSLLVGGQMARVSRGESSEQVEVTSLELICISGHSTSNEQLGMEEPCAVAEMDTINGVVSGRQKQLYQPRLD